MPEALLMQFALGAYAIAALVACSRPHPARGGSAFAPARIVGPALGGALVLHTLALLWRWQTLGHGPFTTMHEILSSSLWSLSLVFACAWFGLREVRAGAIAVVPVVATLAGWMLMADAGAGHFPATYATPLLYLHAVVGKLFLGLLLVALSLASVPAVRLTAWGTRRCAALPDDARFDELAHRFSAFAFVAQTLMLIVGAVWAQDAWGRYWAWDPLESWAFVTWLALAAALHARVVLTPTPARHAAWLLAVFVLAFLTFFGVPFVSTVPHKGAV